MASRKPKDRPNPAAGKFSDDELNEFMSALDSEPGGDEGEAKANESDQPSDERKISVKADSAEPDTKPTVPASKPNPEKDRIDQIWDEPPAEEMKKLTKSKQSHLPWGWITTILILIAAAAVAGAFVFNRAKRFSGNNVQLQFQPVSAAASGNNVTLVLEYQNLEPVDLSRAEVTVSYPDGFTYTSYQPAADQQFHNAFNVGTIRSGQSGQITISGTMIGAVDDSLDFSATLSYRPSTFNSDFQTKTATTVKITSSSLNVDLTGPAQLAPGAVGTWTITYKNTAARDLSNIQITVDYPTCLTIISTKPQADEGTNLWRVATVPKDGQGTITFSGSCNGNLGDSLPISVKAGLINASNTVDLQDTQSLLVVLVKTGLTTSIAINGSTDPVVIQPGDTLNYLVRVSNDTDLEVSNLSVTAKITGAAVDLTKLTGDNQPVINQNSWRWSKDNLTALADLKPGQSVTLTFSAPTLTNLAVKTDSDRDQHVTLTVDMTTPSWGANTNQATQPTSTMVTKIATVLKLNAEARYYDEQGLKLGSGPVPPIVGQTTSYEAFWTVMNTTSDVNNLVVSATLPNNVLWTGQNLNRDAGDLTFDATTREVRWTLNTLPAGTGSRLPELTASFQVAITPTADQLGTVPQLVGSTTAAATDSYTRQAINVTSPSLSTDVPTDAQAGGEGRVVAGQ